MERVRLVEDTALKAAGGNTFAGSIPVLSACMKVRSIAVMKHSCNRKTRWYAGPKGCIPNGRFSTLASLAISKIVKPERVLKVQLLHLPLIIKGH